ncbi:thermonuclease family protein [Candidatus Endoriftia persephonae]|jgi:endonuclease YncB( thermonuclease family)|uniref:TNase-like domain-containing protein n=2 Tax=Gammaproteobacteria TaxID=1236 RepID=G2FFK5_9GAMM|nr:thermonuclease family protein [Candidatus Endoriftia persephone]EGW54421.1 hypothetical protein TevJSym_am00480 [endosymbiont of Tevnia jerichonana (vent Tica)]USF87208.1 thermonuclease family protein [Candidatus Endoriftia persephone]
MHLFLLFLLLPPGLVAAETSASITGQVIAVESGNQLHLSTQDGRQRIILLAHIEPPTTSHSANNARKLLQTLVAGRFVTVIYSSLMPDGALLGTLFHGGAEINLRMVQAGLARFVPDSTLDPAHARRYRQAESRARQYGMGIWKSGRRR